MLLGLPKCFLSNFLYKFRTRVPIREECLFYGDRENKALSRWSKAKSKGGRVRNILTEESIIKCPLVLCIYSEDVNLVLINKTRNIANHSNQ